MVQKDFGKIFELGFWFYWRISRLSLASQWQWFFVCILLLVERFLHSKGNVCSIKVIVLLLPNIYLYKTCLGTSTLLYGPLLHGWCWTSPVSLVQSLWEAAPKYFFWKINCQLGNYFKQGKKLQITSIHGWTQLLKHYIGQFYNNKLTGWFQWWQCLDGCNSYFSYIKWFYNQ